VLRDESGGLLLGTAADLADHDDRLCLRIVVQQANRFNLACPDDGIAPTPIDVLWPMPRLVSCATTSYTSVPSG